MSRVSTPGATLAAAATAPPSPIARNTRIACGLTLTPAPISPRWGAASKTSAAKPTLASAAATANPARPPPTMAMLGTLVKREVQNLANTGSHLANFNPGREAYPLTEQGFDAWQCAACS